MAFCITLAGFLSKSLSSAIDTHYLDTNPTDHEMKFFAEILGSLLAAMAIIDSEE